MNMLLVLSYYLLEIKVSCLLEVLPQEIGSSHKVGPAIVLSVEYKWSLVLLTEPCATKRVPVVL